MSPPPHPSLLPALRCAAGNVWRRAQAPTPGALAAALFVALIAFQLSVHLDERGWNAKASPKDVATVDGHFAEWEWFHPMEAVHALDHPQTLPSSMSSQNVYRFLTAYGMALFYGPTGSLFLAGLLTTLLGWAAAGWAMYALAAKLGGSAEAGIVGVGLAGTAPGFIAYLSNIDAHPMGYAAAAAWLAATEHFRLLEPEDDRAAPGALRVWLGASLSRPILAGILLCVAGYAMEIAYPLLLFAWTFYGAAALARRESPLRAGLRLALFTAAFVVPYIAFRVAVERIVPLTVVAFNEPFTYVRANLDELLHGDRVAWLADRSAGIRGRWLADYPSLLSLLALVGLLCAPWRWRLLAATWVLAFAAAISFTRQAVRDLYFTWPPVYALASLGLIRLADALTWGRGGRDRLDAAARRIAGRSRLLILAAGLTLVFLQVNADLWGDYYLPYRWFIAQ